MPLKPAADPAAGQGEGLLRCDTCGKLTPRVSRVVIDVGYNRANARPVYNCPECYQIKLDGRASASEAAPDATPGAPSVARSAE